MAIIGNNLVAFCGKKWQHEYFCAKCDYKCSKIYNWKKHLDTAKHNMETIGNDLGAKSGKKGQHEYICEKCDKYFHTNSGLWRHNKKCCIDKNNPEITPELIIEIIKQNSELQKQNSELQKQMVEVIKNGTCNNNNNNNTTNTNSHNKSFNLNFFLNETCKDAMNIMDFVDSIKLTLSDLEKVGEKGYVNGISNIISQNLNSLDETKRPVHCTDSKREVMYVKDDNKWEKENNDKKKIRKAIKEVSHKNVSMLKEFRTKYPECTYGDSKYSDKYNNLIIEAMGGNGHDISEKEDKIICNIAKEVTIDKTNN